MITSNILKMDEADFCCLLKISNSTELKKFLHECIDDLVEKRKINFDTYNSESIEWTREDFEKVKKNIQIFYKNCIIENNYNCDTRLENVEQHIRSCLESCLKVRENDIFQYLARSYLLKNGNNLIENIDWRIKWVLGSSNLTVFKETYLQVDLNGVQNCEEKTEKTSVTFEADLQQVEQIIKELLIIKKELSEK